MGLFYPSQQTFVVLGTKVGTTRTPTALTASYADNIKKFETGSMSKLNLDILYTMGATESANYIELKIEGSPDGTNFYPLPNADTSGAVTTITSRNFKFVGADAAAASTSISVDVFYKYVRVSVQEAGVVTNLGTIYIEATLSGK